MQIEQQRIPTQRPHFTQKELDAVSSIFESRWLGLGSETRKFEEAIQKITGFKHVIAVNTGTSALHIALETLKEKEELQDGDEVIVPSLTFVATIQPIVQAGFVPVFCDVQPSTLNMDPQDVERRITPNTKIIMPVHYGGEVCHMDTIASIGRDRDLRIIEDAAHAFGSTYKGKPVGSFSDLVCFSFDPIKNITCGEGGAVATNDDSLAQILTLKRVLGITKDTWSRYHNTRLWDYDVVTQGFRYHMPNLNAAIGLAQLERFEEYRARKREIVKKYDEAFAGHKEISLLCHNLDETFPFFYVIRVPGNKRTEFIVSLKEQGIETGIHYIPNHIQPFFQKNYGEPSLPVTEQVAKEIVTLPLFYEMTDEQITYVIDNVLKFFV